MIEAAGLAIEIARLRVEVRAGWQRSSSRESGSSPPATRNAAGSSETSTTEPSSAWSRSGSRFATSRASSRAEPGGGQLDAAVAELGEAIEELRELARGVRPAGLDDGLARGAARARLALAAANQGRGDR